MIPKDEMKEMNETLSEVAKMKFQFDLLKQVIMNHLVLNYDGTGMRLDDDRLLIEVMCLIDNDGMMKLFDERIRQRKRADETSKEVAMTKEDDING
ncbi:hypothetical protein [Methanobrevibacter sp.]|uniref:hypothetical protein n=1 Tax=Methanobrevibacter sp. TaxID=66852 RepID=UPI00388EF5E1